MSQLKSTQTAKLKGEREREVEGLGIDLGEDMFSDPWA